MASGTFATVINCIDGREKQPIMNWMQNNLHVNYVDQITEPGADKVVAFGTPEQLEAIKQKVLISVNAHHSQTVAIAGHHNCAANPTTDEEHRAHVLRAMDVIASWGLPIQRIIGFWVNSDWQIEVIKDTGAQGYIADSYAVALTCVDGRAMGPLTNWLKQRFLVNYIDLITEPELDTVLLHAPEVQLDSIRRKVLYSSDAHHPQVIAIVAHHDCAGNAISRSDHVTQLKRGAALISSWVPGTLILGLWINETWQIEPIYDSSSQR